MGQHVNMFSLGIGWLVASGSLACSSQLAKDHVAFCVGQTLLLGRPLLTFSLVMLSVKLVFGPENIFGVVFLI